jgi:uncharacterized protein
VPGETILYRMNLRELRSSPGAAWAGPLLVLSAFLGLNSLVKSKDESAAWYLSQPEQWVYPIQTLVTLACIVFWWRNYTFRPLTMKHIALAVAVGVIGIALWLLPSWLVVNGHAGELKALGFISRHEPGFDPTMWQDRPGVYWSVIVLRFLRMTVVVAIAEELFWRGFLWRLLSEPYRDFHQGAFGQWRWQALAAVVPMFALAHFGPDLMVAAIWCLLVSWLYVRTRSVGACIVAHAVSNFLLGIYIMVTQQWGLW